MAAKSPTQQTTHTDHMSTCPIPRPQLPLCPRRKATSSYLVMRMVAREMTTTTTTIPKPLDIAVTMVLLLYLLFIGTSAAPSFRSKKPENDMIVSRLRGRLRNALSLINRRSNRAPEMSSCETCRIQLVSYSHVICRHIRLVSCDLSGTREQQVKWEAPHWRAPPKNCQRWKTYKVPGGEL